MLVEIEHQSILITLNYLLELFNKNYGYKLNLNGIYMLKYLTQASNTFNNITLPSTFLNLFK